MKKILFTLLLLLPVLVGNAQTPQAIWCKSNTTLYFINSTKTYISGNTYNSNKITNVWRNASITQSGTTYPDWYSTIKSSITKVVFDSSFAQVTPTSLYGWFYDCPTLTIIEGLQYLNTSNVTDMSEMFRGCSGLKSLDVSHFDTSNVTDMSEMFRGCSKLTSLDVSHFDTSNVTNMRYMFCDCSRPWSLDVSKFDTSNVTNMHGMFYNCSSLKSLDVSHFDTSNVTNMSHMFHLCSKLTSLDVSKFNTSNVTDMSSMFYGCSSLTSLDVSKFDTSNVTSMGGMFYACSSLTSLDVSNFDTSNVTNMGSMFSGCSSLTTLDLSKFDTSNVTNMDAMFSSCSSLTTLDLNNFDTSNVTNISDMFRGCSSLTSLDLSHFDTSNVTDMGYMFQNCSGLTSLDLIEWKATQVRSFSYMFFNCNQLHTIYCNNFWTANYHNPESNKMFEGCISLIGGTGFKYDPNKISKTYATPSYYFTKVDIVLDENSTTAPVAKENVRVKVLRSINANDWNTIVLPFSMTEEQVKTSFGNDVQLADFVGYTTEMTGSDITHIDVLFSAVDISGGMEANHPYIIKVSNKIKSFIVKDVDIIPVESPIRVLVERTDDQWSEFIGTYKSNTVIPYLCLFLSGNKFYYSTGSTKMKAFRAYFNLYDVLTEALDVTPTTKIRFTISDDKIATGIVERPNSMTHSDDDKVYTIQGQLVGNSTDLQLLPKGVYIVGGKKVLVK